MQTTHQRIQIDDSRAIPVTIKIIGQAIKEAQLFPPLRNHAAALATMAAPKDYLGQLKALFDDVTSHWRYVRDPIAADTLTISGPQIMKYTLGFNGGIGRGYGAGDCDDIAIGLGSMAAAIGFPVRIVTSSDDGKNWNHVFVQAHIPGGGWFTLDPVLWPQEPIGSTVQAARLGYWNLEGDRIGLSGPASKPAEPIVYGPRLPVKIPIELAPGEHAPAIGLAPDDFEYFARHGRGYPGMTAIGTNGAIYRLESAPYVPGLGYHPGDLFRAIGRGIKHAVQGVWGVVEGIFQATKVGRWILGTFQKVVSWCVEKLPGIAKVVGWLGPAVAPVLLAVPGFGPALAAVAVMSGAVSGMVLKFGIPILKVLEQTMDGKEIEFSVLEFPSEEIEAEFSSELSAVMSEFEDLPDDELMELVSEMEKTIDDFDPENPYMLTPKQAYLQAGISSPEAAARQMVATELANRRTAEAGAKFQEALNFTRAAAQRREQSAYAAAKWKREHAPEVLQAAAAAQAAAQARAIITGRAAAAAEYTARAMPEAQAAELATIAMVSHSSPQAKTKWLQQAIADLELRGFSVQEV